MTQSAQELTFERELAAFAEDRAAFRKVTEALEEQGRVAKELRAWLDLTRNEVEELQSRGDEILARMVAQVDAMPQTLEGRLQPVLERAQASFAEQIKAQDAAQAQRAEALDAKTRDLKEEQRLFLAEVRSEVAKVAAQLGEQGQRHEALQAQLEAQAQTLESVKQNLQAVALEARAGGLRGWLALTGAGLAAVLAIVMR